MRKRNAILAFLFSLGIAGCGGASSTGTLSCVASATVTSGSTTTANSTVQLSNLSVLMYNGTGPFTIAVPGLGSVSSTSASYSYTSSFSATTTSSGGLSYVTVVDTGNSSNSASCAISTGTSTTYTSTGSLSCSLTTSGASTHGYYQTITISGGSTTVRPVMVSAGSDYAYWPYTSSSAINSNSFSIGYSQAGTYILSVVARDAYSGTYCNGGAAMTLTLTVN